MLQHKNFFPQKNLPLLGILLLFVCYCCIFSTLSLQKYNAFNHDFDTGNILQAFQNTLDGHFMTTTSIDGAKNACRLQGHTELIYVLLLPLFALFPSAATLLILQTIAIALGGIAVYLIAHRALASPFTAVLLAVCYWTYPLLASINLVDFHADSFMIAPYLFAWYFLKTGRTRLFWCSVFIATLVKEHSFLLNALLGLLLLRHHRKIAVALLLLAIVQFSVVTPLIRYLAGSTRYDLPLAKQVIGNETTGTIGTIAAWKQYFLHNLISRRVAFILVIVLTLNATLIFYPAGLLLIIPLCMVFIAAGSVQSHRHAILIAPLFITLVEGVARIRPTKQLRYVLFAVLPPTVCLFLGSPFSLIALNIRERFSPEYRNVFHYRYTPHDAIADSLIESIPPEVPVAAGTHLRTKLADRRWAFIHPAPADSMRADYYMFDFFEKREYDDAWPARARAAALLKSGNFGLHSFIDGLLLLQRSDSVPKFILPRVHRSTDTTLLPSGKSYTITVTSLVPSKNGCVMHTRFAKRSTDTLLHHALISFFIDTATSDTLRVLHLATYITSRLEHLTPGTYEEQFYFDVPAGSRLENRVHEIWLFKKPEYLPFFARMQHRDFLLWRKTY